VEEFRNTTGKQLSNRVRFDVKWSVRPVRDTCHTDLDTAHHEFYNPHTYPPGYPPIDPQYLQNIENIFQSYVATIEETFKSQFDAERLGRSKQQQQSTSQ